MAREKPAEDLNGSFQMTTINKGKGTVVILDNGHGV